ncbi:MAG: TrmO family methyltransferase [Acetatifactor sp.]|nr:TrmO family methyltransferase [Acetatifactor sp.]
MNDIKIISIGKIENKEGNVRIVLDPGYSEGLKGLEGYSHVQILWWADGCDNKDDRDTLVIEKPYTKGPDEIGVFATRSPARPNPIAVSNADIAYVDMEEGAIGLYYIDALDGTEVLDLKPYVPSIDRIEQPEVPEWCSHWPRSYEENDDFDWEAEFRD